MGRRPRVHGQWHRSWVRATKLEVPLSRGTQTGEERPEEPLAPGRVPSGLNRAPLKRGSTMDIPRGGRLLPLDGHLGRERHGP